MCGIALIICGVRFLLPNTTPPATNSDQVRVSLLHYLLKQLTSFFCFNPLNQTPLCFAASVHHSRPSSAALQLQFTTANPSGLLLCFAASDEHSAAENGTSKLGFWEELPCGIYSLSIDAPNVDGFLIGEVKKHEWTNAMLEGLIKWERTSVEPKPEELKFSPCEAVRGQHNMNSLNADIVSMPSESGSIQASISVPAETVLIVLRESVLRRSSLHKIYQAGVREVEKNLVPVAVLFSGGVDSMIIAALLHECLDSRYEIDLLNVSFDGKSAPDRISAKEGVSELRRIAPLRKWKLVEIDADLSNLSFETKRVLSLINPANTYMDLNIGIALWLAAGGDGCVYEENSKINHVSGQGVKYKSKARIVLVGSGADEQCAGYGRHRTKYRSGSWLRSNEEMKLDMQRIWKGNLDQPSGIGDKKILREVARLLGLHEAATLPKRAIQFGTRIARESNRKNFGSNGAANQASAGSAVIGKQLDMA